MAATAAFSALAIGSGVSAYSQSKSQEAQGDYQRGVYNMNAKIAEFAANDATARGEESASAILRKSARDLATVRRTGKMVVGKQRTALAAQGIEVNSGSAADIIDETNYLVAKDEIDIKNEAELNVLTVKNNAWREAWGLKTQSLDNTFKGRMAGMAADNTSRNTLIVGGLEGLSWGLRARGQYGKNK